MAIEGVADEDCREIEATFQRLGWLRRVWLFGSRAKGTAKPGSDIDLAVEGPQGDLTRLSELRYLLNEESLLPYHFDVIDRDGIQSPELLGHLDRVGQLIYQNE